MQRRGGGHGLGAVLFTDIVGSTAIAAEMGNTRWSEVVARHHRIVRRELARFAGREMDTAGDGFFATFERPADAIRCAVAAADAVRELGIEIRAGVSFGELESVGKKASGLVVNTSARVMSVAGAGEVLVTASVREIVTGGGISFVEHGTHELKGLEGEHRLFTVTEVDGVAPAPPLDPEEAADRRREIFPTGSPRRRAVFVGVGAGVLTLIVVGVLLATGGEPDEGRAGAGPPNDSVASYDAEQQQLGQRIPLGVGTREDFFGFIDRPIAAGEGGVWVIRPPILVHVDPLRHDVRSEQFDVGFANSQSVDTGFGSAWVLSAGTLFKVHPATGEGRPFLVLPAPPGIVRWSFALGEAIWVAESDGTLIRLDPNSGARDQSETGLSVDLIATTRKAVWASDVITGEVSEIDPITITPVGEPLSIGGSVDWLAGRGGYLWVLDRQLGAVTRIDAQTRSISDAARVGDEPTGFAVGRDVVWVSDESGWLYRIDASTLTVDAFRIGTEILGVAVDPADDAVWLYLGRPVAA